MNVKLISRCRQEFSLTLSSTTFVPFNQLNVYKFVACSATKKQPDYGESGFSFEPIAKYPLLKKCYTSDSVFCLTRIETVVEDNIL